MIRRALVGCLLLVAARPAQAVVATYCVDYNVNYTDAASGDYLTGATTAARGVLLRFVRPNGSYFGSYLDWDGPTPGCGTVVVDDNVAYTVKVVHQARIDDIYVISKTTDGGPTYATTVETQHVPVGGSETHYDVGPGNSVRNLAAATWALQRRRVGVSGETIDIFNHVCPGAGTSCTGNAGIWIKPSHSFYKFIIGHELGHMMSNLANGGSKPNKKGNANVGDCVPSYSNGGHKMNSKEYQSIAATEGIAHFYAAMAFNADQPFDDCETEKHYQPDWNRDEAITVDDPAIFSCDLGIPSLNIDNFDYLGDYCVDNGAWQNRGTEYDWLRHFWDVRTDKEVSGPDIFAIWDASNPQSWNEDGIGQGGNYPAARLSDAADAVGVPNKWDNSAASNGVDR